MITCVIDVDRTIAENSARAMLLEKSCKACGGFNTAESYCINCGSDLVAFTDESFEAFLDPELMACDLPIASAQRAIGRFRDLGYNLVFLTGRKEVEHRDVTESWLIKYFDFNGKDKLCMRKVTDAGMKASDYKEKTFLGFRDNSTTYMFFDDDPYIWTMYSKYGLVFRCPDAWEHMSPRGNNRLAEPLRNR